MRPHRHSSLVSQGLHSDIFLIPTTTVGVFSFISPKILPTPALKPGFIFSSPSHHQVNLISRDFTPHPDSGILLRGSRSAHPWSLHVFSPHLNPLTSPHCSFLHSLHPPTDRIPPPPPTNPPSIFLPSPQTTLPTLPYSSRFAPRPPDDAADLRPEGVGVRAAVQRLRVAAGPDGGAVPRRHRPPDPREVRQGCA